MNKKDLVERIATSADLTRLQAAKAVDAFMTCVQDGLCHGERVALSGFGTFVISHRKAKKVRDPRNGGRIVLPETAVVRFSPGHELKSKVAANNCNGCSPG